MAKLTAFFELQDRITSKIANLGKITDRYTDTIERVGKYGDEAFTAVGDIATRSSARVAVALETINSKTAKYADTAQELATIAGAAFAVGGASAVAGVTAVVFAADNVNKSLNHIQSATGAADSEMAGLKSTMLSIYNNNFGEGFDDIGKSLSTVKQVTGASGTELEKLTTNALMLRDTFDMEVNESVRAANTMMKQFGISGDQAYTLVAQAAQNGANKNDDLLDTLNEYSVQFKSLGFNAEQFTNVLIDGAANGAWSIDKVGDAIKEFNIRAKDGSKASAEGFAALGLDAEDMTAKFAQGGDVAQAAFQQVMQTMESIQDPVAKNAAGVALFGTQFEDLEAQGILAFGHISHKASMSADTLQKINAIRYNSIGEAFTGIGRNLETGLLVPLGDKLLPSLNNFATWVTTNMPAIQSNAGAAFDFISGTINFLADNFAIIGPAVGAVILTMIIPAFVAWATAAWTAATGTIIAMAPLIGMALAIGAAVAAVAWLWNGGFQKIVDYTMECVNSIVTFFNSLIAQAFQIGSNFASNIVQGFTGVISGIANAASGVWQRVTGIFGSGATANVNVNGAAIDGSHANGLDYVPYDGYIAELHKGESVLTASETEAAMNTSSTGGGTRSSGNSTSIGSLFGNVTINNEADIAKIIKMIEEYLREQLNSSGDGVYDV